MLNFWKMNGAGNDFVVLDNRQQAITLSKEQIARICDRHRGVGADGMLLVEPAQNGADYRMRYYNADGGEAEMCGNGARCFANYVKHLHGGNLDKLSFETMAGVIGAEFPTPDTVMVTLSEPFGLKLNETLDVFGEKVAVHSVNTGVPHACILVEDLAAVEIRKMGSAIRYHEHFAPAGTNVNFQQVLAPGSIAIRTYERGVEDETLACGTGMVANAIVHHQITGVTAPISVKVAGGDTLQVCFDYENGVYKNVTLTGPADFVFEGTLTP